MDLPLLQTALSQINNYLYTKPELSQFKEILSNFKTEEPTKMYFLISNLIIDQHSLISQLHSAFVDSGIHVPPLFDPLTRFFYYIKSSFPDLQRKIIFQLIFYIQGAISESFFIQSLKFITKGHNDTFLSFLASRLSNQLEKIKNLLKQGKFPINVPTQYIIPCEFEISAPTQLYFMIRLYLSINDNSNESQDITKSFLKAMQLYSQRIISQTVCFHMLINLFNDDFSTITDFFSFHTNNENQNSYENFWSPSFFLSKLSNLSPEILSWLIGNVYIQLLQQIEPTLTWKQALEKENLLKEHKQHEIDILAMHCDAFSKEILNVIKYIKQDYSYDSDFIIFSSTDQKSFKKMKNKPIQYFDWCQSYDPKLKLKSKIYSTSSFVFKPQNFIMKQFENKGHNFNLFSLFVYYKWLLLCFKIALQKEIALYQSKLFLLDPISPDYRFLYKNYLRTSRIIKIFSLSDNQIVLPNFSTKNSLIQDMETYIQKIPKIQNQYTLLTSHLQKSFFGNAYSGIALFYLSEFLNCFKDINYESTDFMSLFALNPPYTRFHGSYAVNCDIPFKKFLSSLQKIFYWNSIETALASEELFYFKITPYSEYSIDGIFHIIMDVKPFIVPQSKIHI